MPFCFRRSLVLPLWFTLLALGGCVQTRTVPTPVDQGAPAPTAAIERMLRSVGTSNLHEMAAVFGTREGSIARRDSQSEVERRMYAMATILKHDSFRLQPGGPVPGRGQDAMQYTVVLKQGQREYQVPFVTVLGPDRRWFVERVDLEAVTSPKRR